MSEKTDLEISNEECDSLSTEEQDEKDTNNRMSKHQDFTPLFQESDHSINKIYELEVPQICKDDPCVLGVDEAGRGPVLGPMVYGIAYIPLSKNQILVDIGCADSKTLSEEDRDLIFDKICDKRKTLGWSVESLSPNFISNSMLGRSKTSLNEISMNSAVGLIKKALEAGVNVAEIYVDTVGPPDKYERRLKAIFPNINKIVVAAKADSTYPIVSAASICAKVARDHAIKAWQFRESKIESDYGSGYPVDPVTKKWLTDNIDPIFGFPHIVRFSWGTADKIIETEAESAEWEELEKEAVPKAQRISNFFSTLNTDGTIQRKKHDFFESRLMINTTML